MKNLLPQCFVADKDASVSLLANLHHATVRTDTYFGGKVVVKAFPNQLCAIRRYRIDMWPDIICLSLVCHTYLSLFIEKIEKFVRNHYLDCVVRQHLALNLYRYRIVDCVKCYCHHHYRDDDCSRAD